MAAMPLPDINAKLLTKDLAEVVACLPRSKPFRSGKMHIPQQYVQILRDMDLIKVVIRSRHGNTWKTTRRWREWERYYMKKRIHTLYWDRELSQSEVGEILGKCQHTIGNEMQRLGIPVRKRESQPEEIPVYLATWDESVGRYV